MFTQNSMPSSTDSSPIPQALNTPEFIDRLAQEMRAKGDQDLPHSHYVEQVKLYLAGKDTPAEKPDETRQQTQYETSDCFRSWAIGE